MYKIETGNNKQLVSPSINSILSSHEIKMGVKLHMLLKTSPAPQKLSSEMGRIIFLCTNSV